MTEPAAQTIEVKPQLRGFLVSYIIFSLPGFIMGLLGILLMGILLLAIAAGLASNVDASAEPLKYSTLASGGGTRDSILVYNLSGVIDTGYRGMPESSRNKGIFTELVAQDFARIKKDSNIKGVVFRMETPGGSVYASEVLGDLMENLVESKGQKQPVFYYDQVVASGGLWSSQKTKDNYVIGSNYGETGSIGVIIHIPNYKKLADTVGYSEAVIKSSQSKDSGNHGSPNVRNVEYCSAKACEAFCLKLRIYKVLLQL